MTAMLDRDPFTRDAGAFRLAMRRGKNRPGVARGSEDDPERVRYIDRILARRRGNETETCVEKGKTNA